MSGDGDELDLLAGEYVLGTLDSAASLAVERRAAAEPALAHAIARWQTRLAPLGDLAEAAPEPKGLWAELAPKLRPVLPAGPRVPLAGPRPGSLARSRDPLQQARRSLAAWRLVAAVALLVATGALGWTLWQPIALPDRAGPQAVATLTAPGLLAPPLARVEVAVDGLVTLHPLAPVAVAPGHSLAFWALPAGAAQPMLLGAIPASGGRLPGPRLPEGSQVMVTLEPSGGPGATPGRTLFAGVVTDLR